MAIIWVPDGSLDIATSPSSLPQIVNGRDIESHELSRAKNLEMRKNGLAEQRKGSTRQTSNPLLGKALKIIEQNRRPYAFTTSAIYRGSTKIEDKSAFSWDAVAYNAFNDLTEQIFAISGGTARRIFDASSEKWGIDAPTIAPTIAAGASTGLTGDYNAKYTYARQVNGTVVAESNPSPAAAAAVTLSDQSLSISWTASSDSQVTHVRVYRTLTGGTTYFFDTAVATGTTTLDTTTEDSAVGGQVETDNDPPPGGTLVGGPFYNGVLFIVQNNLLYYSKVKRPESWPSTNFIEVSTIQDPLRCMATFSGQPYVLSKRHMWLVQGTGANTFFPLPFATMTGAINQYGAVGVEGHGIFHVGTDGIYVFSGGRDRKFSEAKFDPVFQGKTTNGVPGIQNINTSWLVRYGNKLLFHYDAGSVLAFNLDNARARYYQYDQRLYAPNEGAQTNALYVGEESGHRRVLETQSNTDAGTAIEWEAQSKDFTLPTRAHFPRWVKYDTKGSMTGALILDDEVHQTHAISEDRNTRRRLVTTGNGERCALRLTGSTPPTIYVVEME